MVPDKPQAQEKARMVACPQCGVPTPWSPGNPYRPFCTERCKLIDLGQWASEAYRVPVEQSGREPNADE